MPNRITAKFQELRARRRKAFIAFLTAGYPDLATTVKLVPVLEKAGADIIELGVPFSDPIADGPTIQQSSHLSLLNGITIEKIFRAVRQIRAVSRIPLALMTYYNPVFHFGEEWFLRRCAETGIDGLIVPDLPVEEAGDFIAAARRNRIATIFFLSSTTDPARARKIIDAATGFIYYISLPGVTGARTSLPADLIRDISRVKALTKKPVCVGFGISRSDQVRAIARVADGVIIGSAIIAEMGQARSAKDTGPNIARLVKRLTSAL